MNLHSASETVPAIGRTVFVKARDGDHLAYRHPLGLWVEHSPRRERGAKPVPIYGVRYWWELPEEPQDTMAMLFPEENTRIDGRPRNSS